MSYWVNFLFFTPDNKSLSSILRGVMKEKMFFGFQKFCPAFFWGLSLFVQKILLSYLRSKLMIHQPWVVSRKSFFWNPSKTNSFTIEIISVFLMINKKIGHPFKEWSIFFALRKMFEGDSLHVKFVWKFVRNARSNLTDTFVSERFRSVNQDSRFHH